MQSRTHLAEPPLGVVPGAQRCFSSSAKRKAGENEGQRCDEQEGERVLLQPLQLSPSGRGRSFCPR